jgi:Bacterial aa3 type cytochrome c oxidase subunit IV
MGIDIAGGNPSMDYAAHAATYRGFLKFTQYAIAGLVVLLAGMAYFLV